jgi:hypothetical protein
VTEVGTEVPTQTDGGWLIYGCRTPYAAEAAETIWRRGESVVALVDNHPSGEMPNGLGSVISVGEVTPALARTPAVIPLLTPGLRPMVEAEARVHGIVSFPTPVDPTAVVARTSRLGEGTMINAMSMIGANATIASFCTIGPGCVLAGHITLESGAYLGAGVTIAPKVTIGANAVVGAGAVVVKDVPGGAVVVGNPAKVLRQSETGYGGVSVRVGLV